MIKDFIRNLILREKASPERFAAHLKKLGVKMGKNVTFYAPRSVLIDVTYPWLLSFGDNVNIVHGVVILTHDASWMNLKKCSEAKGALCGGQAPVTIGNNVFIGVNAVITKGVTVGDNVIIGVGSVVTHDCESNSVYAGVPAKKIMSIEEFFKKRFEAQFSEAKALALKYKEVFAQEPPMGVFREYFMLFCTGDEAAKIDDFRMQMELTDNFDETLCYMNTNKPMFSSYREFLDACYK